MQSGFAHVEFNVRPDGLPFYEELFSFLGWRTIHKDAASVGLMGKLRGCVWFNGQVEDVVNVRDGPGLNHFAIGAESIGDVDRVATFLGSKGIKLLFETPRHRPEFSAGEAETYYQIIFETPDAFLIEFVYEGPKEVADGAL